MTLPRILQGFKQEWLDVLDALNEKHDYEDERLEVQPGVWVFIFSMEAFPLGPTRVPLKLRHFPDVEACLSKDWKSTSYEVFRRKGDWISGMAFEFTS